MSRQSYFEIVLMGKKETNILFRFMVTLTQAFHEIAITNSEYKTLFSIFHPWEAILLETI